MREAFISTSVAAGKSSRVNAQPLKRYLALLLLRETLLSFQPAAIDPNQASFCSISLSSGKQDASETIQKRCIVLALRKIRFASAHGSQATSQHRLVASTFAYALTRFPKAFFQSIVEGCYCWQGVRAFVAGNSRVSHSRYPTDGQHSPLFRFPLGALRLRELVCVCAELRLSGLEARSKDLARCAREPRNYLS